MILEIHMRKRGKSTKRIDYNHEHYYQTQVEHIFLMDVTKILHFDSTTEQRFTVQPEFLVLRQVSCR